MIVDIQSFRSSLKQNNFAINLFDQSAEVSCIAIRVINFFMHLVYQCAFPIIMQVLCHLEQLILVKALVLWYFLVYLVQQGLHIFSTAPHLLQHLVLAHTVKTLVYAVRTCQCVRQLVTLVAALDQRSPVVWESATVIDFAISSKIVVKM